MTHTEILRIRRPDDWHLHLRDGAVLDAVLPYTARHFARAVVMPNLRQPVCDGAAAQAYKRRILHALQRYEQRQGGASGFEPLMTAYLTDGSDGAQLAGAYSEGLIVAAKLYPAHATTNAAHGVSDVWRIMPVLEAMAQAGMPLLVHAETTDPAVDVFDREAVFLDRVLAPLTRRLPELKVVVEHITTREGVDFVNAATASVAATLTPQHLLYNRNAMFQGGLRPHHYCLPVLKRETHRAALRKAATSGSAKFFLGTDSAPHTRHAKESACGCAGMFNAPSALASYAQVFEEEGALDRLEAFASLNGPGFYGLAPNAGYITLHRDGERVPDGIATEGGELMPFRAGETLAWRVAAST
jgi:dihydroorotase